MPTVSGVNPALLAENAEPIESDAVLVKRARILADMISMSERIAWGEDSKMLHRLADRLEEVSKVGRDATERIQMLEKTLVPFIREAVPRLNEHEDFHRTINEDLPEDDINADAIYLWALYITFGELRALRNITLSTSGDDDGGS